MFLSKINSSCIFHDSRFSYSTSIKFRRAINKRNTKYAENLINSKKTKKYLNKRELSQLRAELSHAFFIFNQDYKAIDRQDYL